VKQDEIDSGVRPGITTIESREIDELRKEVRELRWANEVLIAASSFFGEELDRRRTR